MTGRTKLKEILNKIKEIGVPLQEFFDLKDFETISLAAQPSMPVGLYCFPPLDLAGQTL
jgi:hypothetical protein